MSLLHAGSILFEKTTTVSEHCNKITIFTGNETFRQRPANSFKFKQARHDPTIASSSQDGRHSSYQPRRPWRKGIGLSSAFKTSWTFEARSTEQVVCSPRTSSNISPPDLRPSQPSLTLPHSVCVGVPNNQSTTCAFRTALSGLVLAGNPVSPCHRLPVYPRVVGTRFLWKRKLESE